MKKDTIKVSIHIQSREDYLKSWKNSKRKVIGYKTECKHLAITPSFFDDGSPIEGWFTITHIPTGWATIKNIQSLELARAKAKVLSEIPETEWENLKPDEASAFYDKHKLIILRARDTESNTEAGK